MRHVFNENIATHFAAFVQQKHKDGAAEGCGSQAGCVHLPFPSAAPTAEKAGLGESCDPASLWVKSWMSLGGWGYLIPALGC